MRGWGQWGRQQVTRSPARHRQPACSLHTQLGTRVCFQGPAASGRAYISQPSLSSLHGPVWSTCHLSSRERTFSSNLWESAGASQVVLVVKIPPANAGDIRDAGLVPGLGRSPGGGHGHLPQCSCRRSPGTEEPGGLPVHRPWGHRESDATGVTERAGSTGQDATDWGLIPQTGIC